MPAEKELLYYVGWVDRRMDPWPNHEHLQPGIAEPRLGGQPVEFLPADHPEWPGLPCVRGIDPPATTDGRMGRYTWPGIPLPDHARLYAGPTVAALLHPRSVARLTVLKRAYLLYQPDAPGSPHEQLGEVLFAAARARGVREPRDRVELAAVPGIADPTDFRQIIDAVGRWLRERDPFLLAEPVKKGKPAPARRVFVNLSPGTTAMSASWLILYWSGALGGTRATVQFVQGDGGLDGADAPDNPAHQPLREVPVDVLALVKTAGADTVPATPAAPGVQPEPTVDPEKLGRPYDTARQQLERAAMVGEPVVLIGERGTGKTFLAEFYHRRRQEYRWGHATTPPTPAADPKTARGKGQRPPVGPPWRGGTRNLVKVSLSEFADLNTLKFSLFGWMRESFTGAGEEDYDGLLGAAHEGTLFLDEIHHLPREVQRLLLAPLNFDPGMPRTYAPSYGYYQVASDFDLISATNDPHWREKLLPDLHDRIARIVVRVPALRDYQSDSPEVLWNCWAVTLAAMCAARRIENPPPDPARTACDRLLDEFLRTDPLPGNWRDLQALAAYVLFFMTDARSGRALARLAWSEEQTRQAIEAAAANRPAAARETRS